MFLSKKSSEEVQWHKLKRQPLENELSHPANGKAWKDFDEKHEDFAANAVCCNVDVVMNLVEQDFSSVLLNFRFFSNIEPVKSCSVAKCVASNN
jgi:hypothetical protein